MDFLDYPEKLKNFLLQIQDVDDREERAALLIEIADRFKPVPAEIATRPYPANHRVPACESDAYIWATQLADGGYKFHFAVENPQGISAKAVAVLIDETLSGCTAEEIAKVSEDMIFTVFGKNISMGKGQGLMGMITLTKRLAGQSRENY